MEAADPEEAARRAVEAALRRVTARPPRVTCTAAWRRVCAHDPAVVSSVVEVDVGAPRHRDAFHVRARVTACPAWSGSVVEAEVTFPGARLEVVVDGDVPAGAVGPEAIVHRHTSHTMEAAVGTLRRRFPRGDNTPAVARAALVAAIGHALTTSAPRRK